MTKTMIRLLEKIFQTFDLGLAAALISVGFQLLDLNKSNPRKVQFLFKASNELQEAIEDYWSDNLKVNARTYFENLKMLKNRIYSN